VVDAVMKRFSWVAFALLVVPGLFTSRATAKEPGQEGKKIRVLLTVGGHGFDEKPFFAIFDAMPDAQWTKIELPKEADRLTPGLERNFDVIVMYDMAASFTPRQQKAFVELLNEGIGLVSLHHNMCAHRDWPEFRKIIGGKYIFTETTLDGVPYKPSSYDHDQLLKVSVADKEHPITKGVEDFQIQDETYKGFWTDPRAKVLLKTDHPKNNSELAWVTEYGKSRVFYLMLGHDRQAYDNPGYRKVVHQAIRWAATR
jgi:uncharacterized protein